MAQRDYFDEKIHEAVEAVVKVISLYTTRHQGEKVVYIQ